ncbi:nitroreductase family protein [Clostridium thermopalmarium]|uniref:NADPH-dependent oxidoreductase n=1 Tax=Clostridium thermopalmarium DSM 5974 TaxID=1121340 RepID=A0A2T0AK36_9CLOT|nr:nitroreductase family protein [Clostridium thermopalmarium]MBE6043594.1 nitroreductase [Clostridium thermopalmarium]PRR68791.1 NADPH-dependent oxidoreductase [Clostridium thermopalmarium DSM 5974]PVZ22626.1 nitroreductase [Clostridium thermopalmarium DSM 5974]
MEFLELVRKRHSVRKYSTRKVEEEKLLKILEAGRLAPTAVNFQPQRLIVVQKEEGMEKLKKCNASTYGAPLVIIVCGDHNVVWKRRQDNKDFLDIDVSIVTDHMMLEAADLGLASVWIGSFDPDMIKREFNLPDNVEAINILAIGYETDDNTKVDKNRKPLEEIVHYETY